MTTPRLQLPELAEFQAGKFLTHNAALRLLDALVLPVAEGVADAPAGSVEGTVYIVGATPTVGEAFEGHAGAVAVRIGGGWTFIEPREGWRVPVADTGAVMRYAAGVWTTEPRRVSVPATASDPGQVGEWSSDADYIYICTATDTWKRAALAAW